MLVREVPADQPLAADVSVIAVDDPLTALQAVAADWRAQFDPLVVGITGSLAKTSTKDAVAAVLGARFTTLKSEGNQNNEIGLPLTLLRLRREHEAAVLEMGMYVGGEIALLAKLARPQIGVVTAVHAVHLSRIGSLDAIERAKAELVEALPDDGTAVLNADDERVRRMSARTARANDHLWLLRRGRCPCRAGPVSRPRRHGSSISSPAAGATRSGSRRSGVTRSTTRWPGRRWGSRRA